MTYYDAAKKVLEQSDVPMKVDEIWEKACELGYDKIIAETLNGKMSKTPIASLGAKIYTDIKFNPDTTIFVKVGKGKFLLKSFTITVNIKPNTSADTTALPINVAALLLFPCPNNMLYIEALPNP